MELEQAVALRIKAQAESDLFTNACVTQETEIKEELDGVVGLFKNVLSTANTDAMTLRDGGFLYMKANTSTRAINEARITDAVGNITISQMKRIAAEDECSTLQEVLCTCIEENLEDESISVTYAPNVSEAPGAAVRICPMHHGNARSGGRGGAISRTEVIVGRTAEAQEWGSKARQRSQDTDRAFSACACRA